MMDGDKNKRKKPDIWNCVLLCACIVFYLLFPLLDGPVWCVDSEGYATMHITREPLYPTFLALCRGIARFIDADYLMIAVVLQSLLAAVTTWFLGRTVWEVKNHSRILELSAILFQFAVTLLCRFSANRGSAYTDSILTEGIGLSLFVLFSVQLFLFIQTEGKLHLLWTFLFSFLLLCLRKQMMITLFVAVVVFVWFILIRRREVRYFICLMALLSGVFMAGKAADRTYQYIVRGVWMEHSGNSTGLLCTLLYSSDVHRDRSLLKDEVIEELYLEIMRQADEQQLLYPYAESGWLNVSAHYSGSYDEIGYGIINPVVEGYISGNFDYSETEASMKYDEICGKMSRALLLQHPIPLLKVYLYNTWTGFVNTIAKERRILSLYAVAAYAAVGMMAWYLIIRRKKLNQMMQPNSAGTEETGQTFGECRKAISQIDTSLCFTFIIMVEIIINALVVGLMIFAQSRYMIYGMGLFYTAACMLLYDIVSTVRNRRLEQKKSTAH